MKIRTCELVENNSLIFYVDKEGNTECFVRTLDIEEDIIEED